MKVEMAVLGSPSLIVSMVSVDVTFNCISELRGCVKVEMAVPNSPYGVYGRNFMNHYVYEE